MDRRVRRVNGIYTIEGTTLPAFIGVSDESRAAVLVVRTVTQIRGKVDAKIQLT